MMPPPITTMDFVLLIGEQAQIFRPRVWSFEMIENKKWRPLLRGRHFAMICGAGAFHIRLLQLLFWRSNFSGLPFSPNGVNAPSCMGSAPATRRANELFKLRTGARSP